MPRFLQTPTLVVPFMPNNCMKSMESGSPVKHWYTGPVAMPPRTLPAAACPDHKPPPALTAANVPEAAWKAGLGFGEGWGDREEVAEVKTHREGFTAPFAGMQTHP
jgi:hypothetical protein